MRRRWTLVPNGDKPGPRHLPGGRQAAPVRTLVIEVALDGRVMVATPGGPAAFPPEDVAQIRRTLGLATAVSNWEHGR